MEYRGTTACAPRARIPGYAVSAWTNTGLVPRRQGDPRRHRLRELLAIDRIGRRCAPDINVLEEAAEAAESARPRQVVRPSSGQRDRHRLGLSRPCRPRSRDCETQELKVLVTIFRRETPLELGFDQVEKLERHLHPDLRSSPGIAMIHFCVHGRTVAR